MQLLDYELPGPLCVHGLGEQLAAQNIVVLVNDEAGGDVGFAEEHAEGVGIAHHALTIRDGLADAVTQQLGILRRLHRIGRDHAQRNLRAGAVERRSVRLAALVFYPQQRARRGLVEPLDVRAEDPGMATAQPRYGMCIHDRAPAPRGSILRGLRNPR